MQRHHALTASSRAPKNPSKWPASISAGARHRLGLWALTAPFLIGATALVGVPALLTFALAFYEYDALSPAT